MYMAIQNGPNLFLSMRHLVYNSLNILNWLQNLMRVNYLSLIMFFSEKKVLIFWGACVFIMFFLFPVSHNRIFLNLLVLLFCFTVFFYKGFLLRLLFSFFSFLLSCFMTVKNFLWEKSIKDEKWKANKIEVADFLIVVIWVLFLAKQL